MLARTEAETGPATDARLAADARPAADVRLAADVRPLETRPATDADARFMRAALALGRRGLGRTAPNPAVGALVVRETGAGPLVVGRGWTQPGGRPHAEAMALAEAGEAARGATLYVTLEPCSHFGRTPPCADAVLSAGIGRVVSAIEDPNPLVAGQGHARLRAGGVEVVTGVLAQAARRAHAGHIARVLHGRPHVTLKLAVSADAKIGLAGRKPTRITGAEALARAHLLRAEADAILVGIGTVLADDPLLTCRLPGLESRSPIRVVLDGELRTPPTARLVATARETPTWVITAENVSREREATLEARGVQVLRGLPAAGGRTIEDALRRLAERGATRLLVEGGARVAAGLMAADLVDEVVLFRAPVELGADALGALDGQPLEAALARFEPLSSRAVGRDRMDVYWRS